MLTRRGTAVLLSVTEYVPLAERDMRTVPPGRWNVLGERLATMDQWSGASAQTADLGVMELKNYFFS